MRRSLPRKRWLIWLAVLLGLGGLVSYLYLRWLLTPTVLVPYPDTARISWMAFECEGSSVRIPIHPDGRNAHKILDYLSTLQKQRVLFQRQLHYGYGFNIKLSFHVHYLYGPLEGTAMEIYLGDINYTSYITETLKRPVYNILGSEDIADTVLQMLPKQISQYKKFVGKSLSKARR
ncbi:hypothetical protein D1159_02950 [Pseudoflavonifractor sp. 524-17]|uniref:hypothetical protein n=1 Tax=Pseudoflavonifractor sp. 524-17 TaxID=2304577 RepID=UPI00137A8C57|nr:hypothetical protein [Pseudoflavonifractor sp. 524-17]NCE63564.1 hypothetical protein [Pseudoflavonifractor sp. 524-17]